MTQGLTTQGLQPDGTTLERAAGLARIKAPVSIANGGTAATTADGIVNNIADVLENLCLNPSFETVLPGVHTAAITHIHGSGLVRNICMPGWQYKSGANAANESNVTQDLVVFNRGKASCLCDVVNITGGNPVLRQVWGGTIDSVPQYLEGMVAMAAGRYFNWSTDVKQSSATASACRLFITTDGTGGTTTYSGYHGTNANWERLFDVVLIPTDATYIYFGVAFENVTPDFNVDGCSVVLTEVALSFLAFRERKPAYQERQVDVADQLYDASPAVGVTWYYCNDAAATTPYESNVNRPAWATGLVAAMVCNDSVAGYAMHLRPAGTTRTVAELSVPVANKWTRAGQAKVDFGVNGLFEYSGDATSTVVFVNVVGWYGGGL